jgi:hypothetical protein
VERRFDARLQEMLAQAEVSSEFVQDFLLRLNVSVTPFVASLRGPEQGRHAAEYMTGLFSNLERKTGEGIASLRDQDRPRLQQFSGQVSWDHPPLLATHASGRPTTGRARRCHRVRSLGVSQEGGEICWRCPRTRGSATATHLLRNPRAGDDLPRIRSRALITGVRRCRTRLGRGSRCATVRRDRWWLMP